MAGLAEALDNIVSISSFSRGKSSEIFEKAQSHPVIVAKNNVPNAVIVSKEEYQRLVAFEEDTLLLTEALSRLNKSENEGSDTISRDEILERFGIGEEDLDLLTEPEFE